MHVKKLQLLEEILGECYRSNDEHLFSCPFCNHHKRKLSINILKNTYKCWICDSRGRDIYYLIKKHGNRLQKQNWRSFKEHVEISDFDSIFEEKIEIEQTQNIKLPEEYICLANKKLPLDSKLPLDYLKKRNISSDDILKWKIGYCYDGLYKDRIIIPSFNKEGFCDYFIARTYTNDWLRYKNPPVLKDIIFNDLLVNWNESIILVEGVFDALNAENSIPLLGSTLSTHSKLFKAILTHSKQVYIALDKDAEKKALNIINMLISHGIKICKIDTSNYEDVGEMTKEEFEEKKYTATVLDSEELLIQKILQI
jgi:DNA primase